MSDGLQPEMQGSSDPLILRNYRMIPPQTWKYFNLSKDPTAFQGQHIADRDIPLIFKVEAAPVVLPYESELVLKFTFATPTGVDPPTFSNQWAPLPLYRIKGKSMAHIVKRCWATISNMTFQSYRPPFYLNEILLRKPSYLQMKYPDNYTGEKTVYLPYLQAPENAGAVVAPGGENRVKKPPPDTINDITDDRYGELYTGDPTNAQNAYGVVRTLDRTIPILSNPGQGDEVDLFLQPLTRTTPNDGQLYFMTPQYNTTTKLIDGVFSDCTTLTFRIPFTELLPVFKIGVIPLIMIASNSFDLWIDLYSPSSWFVNCGIGTPVALETYLNVTTVSFPDRNPLAEMLIRPRIFDTRFIAPFLDYLVFENTYILSQPEVQFFFNITQFLRNVPFICISFNDIFEGKPNMRVSVSALNKMADSENFARLKSGDRTYPITFLNSNPEFVSGSPSLIGISSEEASRGGFFNIPPHVKCKDLNIMLGESAFPFTQVPMSWDDMYMYNRKHFEMYGRDFNVHRVSPIGRAYSGDASFFFDLSHSPMTGFQVGPGSPLQITGKLINDNILSNDQATKTIRVCVTCFYSNNFNTLLASGGVLPTQ